MKKNLKSILLLPIIAIFFALLTVQFGPGYEKPSLPTENFDSSAFFSNLQNITGTLFIWPNKNILSTYTRFLEATDDFLLIQSYIITHQTFQDYFHKLSKRWIPIHIILENNIYNAYQNFFKQLQNNFSGNQNVQIRSDDHMGTTYVHSKITLNEDAFRIQTANLTKSSFESNREHFFYSSNPSVRENLELLFDRDRAGTSLSSFPFHPNLVVCPINCRAVIQALLSSAEESIIIQTQYILDDSILQLLRQKSEQVSLHIIVADTITNLDLTTYFGPAVARALPKPYNHTKMILVDEKYLLLGSMNLSDNSLDNNREIWIMLLDPSLIQTFLSGFWSDRKK